LQPALERDSLLQLDRGRIERVATAGSNMSEAYDVAVVGGGIAGSALATVLARKGIAVAVLERDLAPADKVRGEYMAPWGVAELKRLGLLDVLQAAGGLFATRSIPFDENMPGDAALPFTFDLSTVHPQAPGSFCMSHPAMCATLATAAEAAGAVYLRGVEEIGVSAGSPPTVAFSHGGVRTQWRPRLVIGADGRNSRVRHQLGFAVLADPPHNLLGGLLVEGVPDWPQDTQVIGTEDQLHFLIFPQGGDRVRLYLCYDFANKAPYVGRERRENLIAAFAGLRCLPYARSIADARPIGPFNSFSNEDHWIEDPTAPGVCWWAMPPGTTIRSPARVSRSPCATFVSSAIPSSPAVAIELRSGPMSRSGSSGCAG
jgi:2-polyprenyl-6-methoxyphenol hydroxylase-like FAD-dependent oxidoreductase